MLREQLAHTTYSIAQMTIGLGSVGTAVSGRLLRWCLKLQPGHAQAQAWLTYLHAVRALHEGRADEAVELLTEAVSQMPDNSAARAYLGIAYALTGACEEAIYNLEHVLRDNSALSRQGDLWAALVWSYLRTGRVPKARDACCRSVEHRVRTPRLQLLTAMTIGVQTDALPGEAIGQLLQDDPSATPMILEYAQYLASRHKNGLAQQLIESLPCCGWGAAYRVVAQSALNGSDLPTAIWATRRFRAVADDDVSEAILLSEISLRRQCTDEALAQARKAVARDEGSAEAHEQLGKVLLLRGDWSGAVAEMIEALHVGPASALAAGLAALASISAGDFTTARGLFRVQRKGDGLGVACAHVAHCRILQHHRQHTEALKLATWALQEIEQLPAHLRVGPLVERLAQELKFALANLNCPQESDLLHQLHRRLAALASYPTGPV